MGSKQYFEKQYGGRKPGKIDASLDAMLQSVEWGEYKLGDLFEVKSNPQLDKSNFTFSEYGKYPYFTRTIYNNGILGNVDYLDEEHKIQGECIAVGMLSMQFFYMQKDFYAGQFTKRLIPKDFVLNPRRAQFINSLLNKYSELFKSVLVRDFENKFINYGEIDKEEVDEPKDTYFNKVEVQPVNVSTIKENAMDIKAKTSEPAADLDSLLNIQNVRPAQGASFVTKAKDQYLTPAEAIVKGEQHEEEQKDYFKIPNMGATGVSLDSNPAASAPVSILNIPAPVQEKTTYTIDDVTNKIREVVKDLESHGVKVTFDEMNFDTAYQVIIKVDK